MATKSKKKESQSKPPKGSTKKRSKPPQGSAKKKKENKRKIPVRIPSKLLASFWWIIAIVTFLVGVIGLVNLILKLYLRGGADWDYALIVTPLPREVQMVVYGFKGSKRDINIRMKANVSHYAKAVEKPPDFEVFEIDGLTKGFKEKFKEAEKLIPSLYRSTSPIFILGAGDMRLLRRDKKERYEGFMQDFQSLLKKSRLMVSPQSLITLHDWEEGLHGWVALNYLADLMTKGRQPIKSKRELFTTRITLGGLDIGHSSLHISYEIPPILEDTKLPPGVKERVRVITLYGRVYYIYTKTLPCYGAVRLQDMYMGHKLKYYRSPKQHYDITNASHYCFNEPRKSSKPTPTAATFTQYLNGTCSRNNWSETVDPQAKYDKGWIMRYGGSPDPEKCLGEIRNMISRCRELLDFNECVKLDFPPRPYNITFTGFNEFAAYAQTAGLKSGDTKEDWLRKQKDICSTRYIKEVRRKYPSSNADKFHYHNLCLMISFIYIFLTEKINLTDTEWKQLKILLDVDNTRISWRIGYLANLTNTFPTRAPFHVVFSLEDIAIQGLIYSVILTVTSVAVSFALRNGKTLATRPLKIPQ